MTKRMSHLLILVLIIFINCGGKKDTVSADPGESTIISNSDLTKVEPKHNRYQCVGEDEANWELIGPHSFIDSKGQWHGYVWKILGDERNYPQDPALHSIIGTAGSGLWRYEKIAEGDFEWICKSDELNLLGLRINDIVRSPCDPDQIFAATGYNEPFSTTYGTGILVSNDNGESWEQQPFRKARLTYDDEVLRIIPDKFSGCEGQEPNFYVLSRRFKKMNLSYVSSDGYKSCNLPAFKKDFYFVYDIEIVGKNSLMLSSRNPYGSDAELFFSGNKGKSWTNITNKLPEFPFSNKPPEGCNRCSHINQCYCHPGKISISEEVDGKVFLYCDNQMIYKSIDRGNKWELLPIQKLSRVDNNKIDIAYSNSSGVLYFGGIQPWLYKEEEQHGYKQGHDDVRDYHFLGFNEETNEETVILANDGGVSLVTVNTQDFNTTWEDICGDSFPIAQIWALGVAQSKKEEYVMGVMHCNSFHFDGEFWEKIGGGDGGGCLIDPFDKSNYFASGNSNLIKYSPERKRSVYRNNKWFLGSPVKLHPANANQIYFGKDKGKGKDCGSKAFARLIIYDDETGKKMERPVDNCGFEIAESIGLSYTNPSLVFIGDGKRNNAKSGQLLRSDNNGETWTDLSDTEVYLNDGTSLKMHELVAWRKINDILINPYNEREIFICISNHGEREGKPIGQYRRVLRSKNGGDSWVDFSFGLPHVSANCFVFEHGSDNRIFLGTDWGVYYTDRASNEWMCFNGGLPNCIITEMEINYCRNELIAGTYGRGIWKTELNLPKKKGEITIRKNETWQADRVILSDIRIKKNKTLDVQGRLRFAEGCNIILEKNAKVLIESSNLSCLCEESECGEILQAD